MCPVVRTCAGHLARTETAGTQPGELEVTLGVWAQLQE